MSVTVRSNAHIIEETLSGKNSNADEELAYTAVWEDDGGLVFDCYDTEEEDEYDDDIVIDYYDPEDDECEEESILYGFEYPDYEFIQRLKRDEEGFVISPSYWNILVWTKYLWLSLIGFAVVASGVLYYLNTASIISDFYFSAVEGIVVGLTVFLFITVLEVFRITADQKVQFHNGRKYGFEEGLDYAKMIINKGN